jgi:hypothetical protein
MGLLLCRHDGNVVGMDMRGRKKPDVMTKPELVDLAFQLRLGSKAALSAQLKGDLLRQVKEALK